MAHDSLTGRELAELLHELALLEQLARPRDAVTLRRANNLLFAQYRELKELRERYFDLKLDRAEKHDIDLKKRGEPRQ